MKNAVDRAPIGIILADATQPDNPLTYVNDGFVAQTGYRREEALGRNCRFLQGDGTDEQTVAQLRRKIDAEEPVSVTIRNYRANGSGYWNRVEIAPVRDEDGTVVEYIGFQQDVTDLVQRQQQLQTLDRYLRHNMRNKMTVVNGQAEPSDTKGSLPSRSTPRPSRRRARNSSRTWRRSGR
ncbi:PAS domain-containing protein [Halomicroarcula sp. GCM10025710]